MAIHGFGAANVEVKTFDATTRPRVKPVPDDFQSNGGTSRFRATVARRVPDATACVLVEAGSEARRRGGGDVAGDRERGRARRRAARVHEPDLRRRRRRRLRARRRRRPLRTGRRAGPHDRRHARGARRGRSPRRALPALRVPARSGRGPAPTWSPCGDVRRVAWLWRSRARPPGRTRRRPRTSSRRSPSPPRGSPRASSGRNATCRTRASCSCGSDRTGSALPRDARAAAAAEWRDAWRRAVPDGVVAVLDAGRIAPSSATGRGGIVVDVRDPG